MPAKTDKKFSPTTRPADADLPIDTSRMPQGQAQALDVAERARDSQDITESFGAQLFLGSARPDLIEPFPSQDPDDAAVGDDLVARVSNFLRANLDPEAVDETRTIPEDVIQGLKDLGVFRMKVPAEYGGLAVSQVNYNRVIMAVASYCASTAVLISAHQSIGVPQPLKMFGTPEQKARFFPRISEGALSAFALTEPDVGSDPARMNTMAIPSDDGAHYVIDGVKQWTTNGPIAELLVVMARTPDRVVNGKERRQITAFLVEADTPGVNVEHRCDFMGLRGIQNGIIRFEDVRVPAENILWGEGLGLKLALRTLNTGRLTLPAACTGLAKQCLSLSRRWSAEREQWGLAIGRHEAGADKIADLASTTFAMEAVTWLTSHWGGEGRDVRIEAALAKLFCSEAAWRLVDETMQLRGGRGYERARSLEDRGEVPMPIERMMRDARINTIIEGTSEIMRLFLAREALDPHLTRTADLLRPGLPLSVKARAGLGALGHYARWYPSQQFGRFVPQRTSGVLSNHLRYIDRTAHRMAASLMNAMVRHGPALEKRQMLLGGHMDIACELFAMSAACACARSRQVRTGSPIERTELADVFCQRARERIATSFASLPRRHGKASNRLAGDVLDGRYSWLERGVISLPGCD